MGKHFLVVYNEALEQFLVTSGDWVEYRIEAGLTLEGRPVIRIYEDHLDKLLAFSPRDVGEAIQWLEAEYTRLYGDAPKHPVQATRQL